MAPRASSGVRSRHSRSTAASAADAETLLVAFKRSLTIAPRPPDEKEVWAVAERFKDTYVSMLQSAAEVKKHMEEEELILIP